MLDDPPRAPARRLGVAAGAVALALLVDQLTKAWAVTALADKDIGILGDWARLSLTRNSGAAFSRFQGITPILAVAAVAVTIYLIRTVRATSDPILMAGLVLVLAGALGNLVDRLFRSPGPLRGEVVDFIAIGDFPVFNVADICITIGVAILVIRSLFGASLE